MCEWGTEQQAALTVQVRLLKLMPLYMQWIATVTGLQDQTVDKINRPLFTVQSVLLSRTVV